MISILNLIIFIFAGVQTNSALEPVVEVFIFDNFSMIIETFLTSLKLLYVDGLISINNGLLVELNDNVIPELIVINLLVLMMRDSLSLDEIMIFVHPDVELVWVVQSVLQVDGVTWEEVLVFHIYALVTIIE